MKQTQCIGTGLVVLSLAISSTIALAADDAQASADNNARARNSITIDLPNTTQGPLWPPAEVTDENGNYILVGNVLKLVKPGMAQMFPHQAVLVSKQTVPPLDKNGIEDPENWFGAGYRIIRPLNLQKGSPDLDMELHSSSFGPAEGSGRTARIPAIGDSRYNLNADVATCPEAFPGTVQRTNYFRPSYPLHQVPIVGFQGDSVVYDADTGDAHTAMTATNIASCAATGCPGEDQVDTRRNKPITLGEWLKAKGQVKITLTQPNGRGQFTHAKFDLELHNLLPNSVYSVWAVRPRQIPVPGVWKARQIDPLSTPNVLVTDSNGDVSAEYELANPFPDAATDTRRLRIVGLSVVFHSDAQNWGACFSRFGPSVDVHAVFSTLNSDPPVPGTLPDMTSFVTVAR